MLRRFFCAFAALLLLLSPALAMGREELRARWQSLSDGQSQASPYASKPDLKALDCGALTDEAQQSALDCLNFLRAVAGLEEISLSPLYTLRAQNGALLLAVNDELSHNPPRPTAMDTDLYESALLGTSMGNIAKFNWMRPEILIDGVRYFARDDGAANLSVLGHRRWLLNPHMAETGFGLANSESGMSYVTMYAVDGGNAGAQWDHVAWPGEECFPVELMRSALPWSVSLNPAIYDAETSVPVVVLREEVSGAEFVFDTIAESGDGYCRFSREGYGAGPCIIFRPDVEMEYVQNQRWTVEITGLKTVDGAEVSIIYTSEMTSLYPQDVANVEMSLLEAEMAVGDTLQLHASIIPAYADDLAVIWSSSDEGVAVVDESGLVTAIGAGSCEITATSINGRQDSCIVTVK